MTEPTRNNPAHGNPGHGNPGHNRPSEYVTVEIYDQLYHLSGQDPVHIRELAAVVDAKMRAVAAHGRTADSLRVAVLAGAESRSQMKLRRPLRPICNWAMPAPRTCACCWMKCWKSGPSPARSRASKSTYFAANCRRTYCRMPPCS
ncbi:MAG: cell division protein ZapA [Terracidiphilus sp.]